MNRPTRKHTGSASRAAPPLLHEEDGPEGAEILSELPSDTGLVLVGAIRDLMLWIETPENERKSLFRAGAADRRNHQITEADVGVDLWTPLLTIAYLTETPAAFDVRRLLHASRSIMKWAEDHGAPAVRLAFAQAIALLRPDDAAAALEVGRLARDAAQYARAETWLRWAIQLARGGDQETYVSSYIALGVLYRRIGNHPAACTVAQRAARAARRHGLRELEGLALHNLFIFASDGPDVRKAYTYVWDAVRAYSGHEDRLAILAHDVASFWCDRGRYARAAPIIEAVLPKMDAPHARALAASNLARASAGAGHRDHYEVARRMAVDLTRSLPGSAHQPDAFLTIARADALMGEWERAEDSAILALTIATARGEKHVMLVAEAELAAIRTCRAADDVPAEETPGLERHAERLAGDLIRSLDRLAA
jgi:tetratricopeptide (TPR) repeat protein